VDAGFDCLNPVQTSATGMDPEALKAKYGSRVSFWGGGIDTQKVLPFGTPEEVKEMVRQRMAIFGAGGGFVFNTIHNVQPAFLQTTCSRFTRPLVSTALIMLPNRLCGMLRMRRPVIHATVTVASYGILA